MITLVKKKKYKDVINKILKVEGPKEKRRREKDEKEITKKRKQKIFGETRRGDLPLLIMRERYGE